MVERKISDPKTEPMKNFHCYMPGGIYRYDINHPEGSLAEAMQLDFKKYEEIIDCDESTWPETAKKHIKHLKTKRDIQREIDKFLEFNPTFAKRWEAAKEFFQNGGIKPLREYALRPIYVVLREKFSQEELSS